MELFIGEFEQNGQIYEVVEDDYINLPEELTDLDTVIKYAKLNAINRIAKQTPEKPIRFIKNMRDHRHIDKPELLHSDPFRYAGNVLIFDGNNLAHRCRHTYNLSFKGQDVSVLYGVLAVMASTVNHFRDVSSILICWDNGVPEFRYKHMSTYKRRDHSNDATYPEFIYQLTELAKVFQYFGVYSLRLHKAEADDLMYHSSRLINGDYAKIIVTTDADLLQCVKPDVSVWRPIDKKLIRFDNFESEVGVQAKNFLWYRSMVGDSSDGIPGVRGIGEATALKLIDYGSINNLLAIANGAATDKPMSAALADKIKAFGVDGFENTLSTIRLDIDRVGARDYLSRTLRKEVAYDHEYVTAFLKKYNFISLLNPDFYDIFRGLSRPILMNIDSMMDCKFRMPRISPVKQEYVKF